jgi:hypothetical protein
MTMSEYMAKMTRLLNRPLIRPKSTQFLFTKAKNSKVKNKKYNPYDD